VRIVIAPRHAYNRHFHPEQRIGMRLDRERALSALRTVKDPTGSMKDVVSLGAVKSLSLNEAGTEVTVSVEIPPGASAEMRDVLERDVTVALRRAGAEAVRASITVAPRQHVHGGVGGGTARAASPLPQVKNLVAVGAGKGGVGKSTISLNLAIGLQRAGAAVGLMDGDIYGPSMPTMLGIKGQRVTATNDGRQMIVPFHVHGIHAITIGSLVDREKPLIWRGPMAHGAFKQLLLDNTAWPELDYLIIDLPPGTGDVPLTLCQLLPLTGAVVVATPQQVALDDAVRAVRMFQELGVSVLGMVENMSYLPLPDGGEMDLFGRGGAKRCAQDMGLPFLGEVPMFKELRENSDAGTPHNNFDNPPQLRDALESLVTRLAGEVRKQNAVATGPTLTIS
jgi:ATP-binding protein involved in chromosome partitioning